MQMHTYIPTEKLRPFIKAYRIVESQGELVNRILPDTSFALAFRLRGEIAYVHETGKTVLPGTTFSGLRKSARLINYKSNSAALVVLFNETGISAFFKQPLHVLFEESVSLDHFFPQTEVAILEECLAEAPTHVAKIAVVEAFLSGKLTFTPSDFLVAEAVSRIHATQGAVKIHELAKGLFISQDAFGKRFRKVTGTTPKQFASIVRMKALIRHYPEPSSFLDLALDNGYYDQPHFNKDFKLFTGQTPSEFYKLNLYW